MPTNGTPPLVNFPIEQANLYVMAYYANNAMNTAPEIVNLQMVTTEQAIEAAKTKILAENNEGVCVLYPAAVTVVFPAIPWEDF